MGVYPDFFVCRGFLLSHENALKLKESLKDFDEEIFDDYVYIERYNHNFAVVFEKDTHYKKICDSNFKFCETKGRQEGEGVYVGSTYEKIYFNRIVNEILHQIGNYDVNYMDAYRIKFHDIMRELLTDDSTIYGDLFVQAYS